MFPKITLVGKLTQPPTPGQTSSGQQYCQLSVACSGYSGKTRGNETSFFNFTVWQGTANFAINYLTKGDWVLVDGHLVNRNYTDNTGKVIYHNEIFVRELEKIFVNNNNPQQQSFTTNSPTLPPKNEQQKIINSLSTNKNTPTQLPTESLDQNDRQAFFDEIFGNQDEQDEQDEPTIA